MILAAFIAAFILSPSYVFDNETDLIRTVKELNEKEIEIVAYSEQMKDQEGDIFFLEEENKALQKLNTFYLKRNSELNNIISEYKRLEQEQKPKPYEFNEENKRLFHQTFFEMSLVVNPGLSNGRFKLLEDSIWKWCKEFNVDPERYTCQIIYESKLKNVEGETEDRGYGQVLVMTAIGMNKILRNRGYKISYRTWNQVYEALIADPEYNLLISIFYLSWIENDLGFGAFGEDWTMSRIGYLSGPESRHVKYVKRIDKIYEDWLSIKEKYK
jgi:hypothetical protein